MRRRCVSSVASTHQRKVTFAIPGDLATPTGGYGYAREVIASLRARGWEVEVVNLGDGFPHVDADQRAHARQSLLSAPKDVPVVVDGLALGVLADEAQAASRSHCLVGLVHHPLASETGLAPELANALRVSETRALGAIRHVITTDHSTAAILSADYAVAPARISVALPGTRRMSRPPAHREGPARILAVGAIVPRKGYDLLVRALAALREFDWHLTLVGDRTRSPEAVGKLDRLISELGLGQQIICTGAVSAGQLDVLHGNADLFVQSSWFEGYGMALADAIAYGLPVVATRTGAAPRLVVPDAGLLITPGDLVALTHALRLLISDTVVRERYAMMARAAAQNLPTWQDTVQVFEQVLSDLQRETPC
jgi:glycosyltransferase involved in cell wall biosynthesis